MGLINYKDIDFNKSINKENKIINFNGSEIQIINYLSVSDKYELIEATIKKSYENEVYNPIKLEMYFNLHLIYMYTNIIFDIEDKTDDISLYDTMMKSGLIKLVKDNIDPVELKDLSEKFIQTLQVYKDYNSNVVGFLSTLVNDLIEKALKGIETLQNIKPEIAEEIKNKNPQLATSLDAFVKLNK